jgi:hypothetical protein
VLATHGLARAEWNELERRWTRTAEVAAAGSTSDRFVAAFERARQRVRLVAAIKLGEYLRVLTAVAKGDPGAALAELSLEPDDLPLLQRTWTRRAARDPEVAKLIAETDDAGRDDPGARSVTTTSTLTTTTSAAGAAGDASPVSVEPGTETSPPVPSPPDSATRHDEPPAAPAASPRSVPPPPDSATSHGEPGAAPTAPPRPAAATPGAQKPIKKRR